MQRETFDELDFICSIDECYPHEIEKLYELGSHEGYGCTKCGAFFHDKAQFKNTKQYMIRRFKMDFTTINHIDRDTLLHKGYTEFDIEKLLNEGLLSEMKGYDVNGAFANVVRYHINIK